MRVSLVLLAAAAASLCLLGSAAGGSFPGANGLIGFTCGLSVCQSLADGTSAGALISDGADPAWSADGTKIAFVKAGDVWTANADGSNQQLVVAAASNPTWSPSGALAYVKADGHIYERFGSTETQLTSGSGTEGDPAFSPDGTKLAFESATTGSYDLYVVTVGLTTIPASPLVASPADDITPSWSPDGTSIVFVEGTTLYRVAAAGGTATSLGITGLDPSYSPDGTKIAYVATGRLTVADASGTNPRVVNATLSAQDTDWGKAQPAPPPPGGNTGTGPRNTIYPTITNAVGDASPVVGHILTASVGSWTGIFPITYTYQWKRCDAADPLNGTCAAIPGATFSTYAPAPADFHFRLRVAVTAKDSSGSTSQNSEVTAPVEAIAPRNTATPPITPGGTNQVEQTLTVATGTWAGSTPITFTYSWRRCNPAGDIPSCIPIVGATAATYVPTVADIGLSLRVWVTGTNTAGTDFVITNHTFPIVDKPHFAPSATAAPTITGTALPGRELTADAGAFKGDAPITTVHHWERCDATGEACRTIDGATKMVYNPTDADIGFTVRFIVNATNAYGQLLARSDPTDTVAALPPHVKGRRIVGTDQGNYLAGGAHDDTILGLGGNDTLLGGAGYDLIDGGPGNDVITGGAGEDHMIGGDGSDTINAADGERDVVDCGAGADRAVVDSVDVVHDCEVVVASKP